MLHPSPLPRAHPCHHKATASRGMWWRPTHAKYRSLERFVRDAAGYSKYEQKPSARPAPQTVRFNPESVLHTKAQTGEGMKWWHHQRLLLPDLPPEGWAPATPRGRAAWPRAWEETHARRVLQIPRGEIRPYLLRQLQRILHEEIVKDGYDMREVDYEGKPLTELPEMAVVESFVLQEPTLRDRVLRRVLEEDLRLPVSSVDRKAIRSTATLIKHVESVLEVFREPENLMVPQAVEEFIANYPVQPKFGFQFALPQPTRGKLEQEWEKLFLHDWQFGRAVYTPRSKESTRGNLVWLRLSQEWKERKKHHERYQLGKL